MKSKIYFFAVLMLLLPSLTVATIAPAYASWNGAIRGYVYEDGIPQPGLTVNVYRTTNRYLEHGGPVVDLEMLEGTAVTDPFGYFEVTGLYAAINDYRVDVITPCGILSKEVLELHCWESRDVTFCYTCEVKLEVEKYFTDTCGQPIPDDTVRIRMDQNGRIRGSNPGGVLAWIEIRNTGTQPIDSMTIVDTLPHGWRVSPRWSPARSGVKVYVIDHTTGEETRIGWKKLDVVLDTAEGIVTINIQDITDAIGRPLNTHDTLKVRIKLRIQRSCQPHDPSNLPSGVNIADVTAYEESDYQGPQVTGHAESTLHYTVKIIKCRCWAFRWFKRRCR